MGAAGLQARPLLAGWDFPAYLCVALRALHAFLFTSLQSEGQPARGLFAQTGATSAQALGAHRTSGGWWAGPGPRGSACWGPDPGPGALFTGASSWPLGARSGGRRWIIRCRSVSASCLPVTPPHPQPPASLPLGAETGATLGFPRRAETFLLLVESWSSCSGLSGPYLTPVSLLQVG